MIFLAQTTRMAYFSSPVYGYQCQSGQREFSQALSQQYQHNGFDGNIFEGQQQQGFYWNQGCLQDYGTSPSSEMPPYMNQLHIQTHYQPEVYNLHHYPPQNGNAIPPQPIEEVEEDSNVELILENKSLWEKFSQFVTEMIITRAGRYASIFNHATTVKSHSISYDE